MRNDFAVFILTHGRANNVKTIPTLRKCGYTGKIYLVVDNEDEQIEEYKKIENTTTVVFNKMEEIRNADTVDNFEQHCSILYARNVCFKIAKKLGIKYFVELDDDYVDFMHRYETMNEVGLRSKSVRNLDRVFDAFIKFLDDSGAVSVAMSQGGDMIGGAMGGNWEKQLLRKAMNSFFCSTDKEFEFKGCINEDVNTYTTLGQQGKLFFTVVPLQLIQTKTQSNEGGLTEMYLDLGTYVKSFYSVICSPSCVRIITMGALHRRIHHKVLWNNCTPKILNEKWKKK